MGAARLRPEMVVTMMPKTIWIDLTFIYILYFKMGCVCLQSLQFEPFRDACVGTMSLYKKFWWVLFVFFLISSSCCILSFSPLRHVLLLVCAIGLSMFVIVVRHPNTLEMIARAFCQVRHLLFSLPPFFL